MQEVETMNNDDLIQHLERQMEECAQMGEPPSFGLESQADMHRILKALRTSSPSESESTCHSPGGCKSKLCEYGCRLLPSPPSASEAKWRMGMKALEQRIHDFIRTNPRDLDDWREEMDVLRTLVKAYRETVPQSPAAAPEQPEMIYQTEFGETGNCQSACLAMMLGIPLSDVPNFAAYECDDDAKFLAQQDWLKERGLWLMTVVKWQTLPWPPKHGYYIAGGISPRGPRHSVIFKDGALWFDPHPDKGGLVEVQDADFILPLGFRPAAPSPVPQAETKK